MVIFPIIAATVSVIFSIALMRQFVSRRRPAQLAWGVSLAMYAIASLAVAAGVGGGWDPTLYRAFWLFGALLNVPWLALGSIALLGKRTLTILALAVVLAGSLFAFVIVLMAHMNAAALATRQIPTSGPVFCRPLDPGLARGAKVALSSCDRAKALAQIYSIPSFLIVVGIAAISGRKRGDARLPRRRVIGNWIIAAGVTINAVGGFALIGRGHGAPFSIVLALSVTTMFVGFLMASRPQSRAADAEWDPT
ncbi:MAG: hypothetical protein NVSMB57_08250 [Actinomycetota bacterium]